MQPPVILSALEQEYLLHIIESAAGVRAAHDFFLWTQGQLQALLPHALMVAMQFGPDGAVLRTEAVHASVLDGAVLARLCDPEHGLAPRLARQSGAAVLALGGAHGTPAELAGCGFDNALVHGTGPLASGASAFALFGLPGAALARQGHFLALLLPHLHLALARLAAPAARAPAARALSGRETEILQWLREGKKNAEIGAILGISALTVKNHL
ncbi:MAG TPA: LuxR C-terminal-related transcriptional regulator, partial [Telluria sp.]|nr:LuxR C-terminal-related transcriptional regulator [Telluria sp.]